MSSEKSITAYRTRTARLLRWWDVTDWKKPIFIWGLLGPVMIYLSLGYQSTGYLWPALILALLGFGGITAAFLYIFSKRYRHIMMFLRRYNRLARFDNWLSGREKRLRAEVLQIQKALPEKREAEAKTISICASLKRIIIDNYTPGYRTIALPELRSLDTRQIRELERCDDLPKETKKRLKRYRLERARLAVTMREIAELETRQRVAETELEKIEAEYRGTRRSEQ